MAGGGGAWKVAYADFVTAMMAFFMVMWLVGQKQDVKEAIAQHFSPPNGDELFSDTETQGGMPVGRGKLGKLKGNSNQLPTPTTNPDDPDAMKPRLLTLHGTERTETGAVVPFEGQSDQITEQGKMMLNQLLPKLTGRSQKIEVRGHCSGRPLPEGHKFESEWQLSYARALATLRYLEQHGIEPERIRLSQAGKHEPFTLQENLQRQARNERVEVYMLNECVTDLQGTPEERQSRVHK